MSEIELRDVSKTFPSALNGSKEVLRALTLKIPSGEILAIVGASGSGKNSLHLQRSWKHDSF